MNEGIFNIDPYIVYVRIDDMDRIISINSSAFLTDTSGWIEIDRGFGDKYHHAQGNYLSASLFLILASLCSILSLIFINLQIL